MADNLTTSSVIDPAVRIFYDRTLLQAATAELVHERWAQKRPIPKKSGDTVKFRRYSNLTVATTPLSEGVTPPGQQLAKTDLTARVSQYGDFVHITDVVDMTIEDPEMTVAAEKLGYQMGQTRDVIIRDILAACASSTNASGGSNGGTPTEITISDIDGVVKSLLGGNAKMMTAAIGASSGTGTSPVRPAFRGVFDSAIVDDLEDVSGFVPTSAYPSNQGLESGEWGVTKNVRWVMTTEGYTTGSPVQYYLPIIGKEAYGVTDLGEAMDLPKYMSGESTNKQPAGLIVKPFGSGGTSDPLNQRATAGWKMFFVARILNDAFMHILKVTHS